MMIALALSVQLCIQNVKIQLSKSLQRKFAEAPQIIIFARARWWLWWCGGVLIINCIPAVALSTQGSTGPAPGQGARRLQIIIRALDSLSEEKQGYIICSTYSFLQPYILLFS